MQLVDSKMVKGVSIVLCTYNGKDLLVPTFEHLVAQKISVPVELVFVDNASNDGTKIFADLWWKKNKSKEIEYRSFEQPIPGKSYAQNLGYHEARFEYILVCDDDNWLCDIYVQTAYDIMENNLNIGALGGRSEAVFQTEKPEWFDRYAKYFAVAQQGKVSGDITGKKGCLFGAGMVIRKSHWLCLKNNGFEHILSCRKGNELSSGGDTEYCYALRLLGYKIWYDDRLYFKHFIAGSRLNLAYLSRLRKALVHSNFILWPYLDSINNVKQSRMSFLKAALQGMPLIFFKNLINILDNRFDKRENGKTYFRFLYRRLFLFSIYKTNFQRINKWYHQNH